jgi:hypothetical protein
MRSMRWRKSLEITGEKAFWPWGIPCGRESLAWVFTHEVDFFSGGELEALDVFAMS